MVLCIKMTRVFLILFVLTTTNFVSKSQVNPNLFGFRTSSSFVFFDVKDSVFMNDVQSLSPNVLSFPGGFGNFYHLNGVGYGLEIEEIKKKTTTNIAIQIDGKTKEVIQIEDKISKEEILDIVKNNNKIKKNLIGKNVIREIYVPGKIVNLVIK